MARPRDGSRAARGGEARCRACRPRGRQTARYLWDRAPGREPTTREAAARADAGGPRRARQARARWRRCRWLPCHRPPRFPIAPVARRTSVTPVAPITTGRVLIAGQPMLAAVTAVPGGPAAPYAPNTPVISCAPTWLQHPLQTGDCLRAEATSWRADTASARCAPVRVPAGITGRVPTLTCAARRANRPKTPHSSLYSVARHPKLEMDELPMSIC
jgi:hypothetical protein